MNVEVLSELNAVVAAGDASATRTVYGIVLALGAIGVALVVLAIWLFKQTKPERQLLAPLERMDDRSWRKQDPAEMRRDLDAHRPEGARPVLRERSVPEIDEDFAQSRPALATFDDLQAQLAADVRRRSRETHDPLLATPVPAEAPDDDTVPADDDPVAEIADDAVDPGAVDAADADADEPVADDEVADDVVADDVVADDVVADDVDRLR